MQDSEARASVSEKDSGIEKSDSHDGQKNVSSEKVIAI